MQESSANPSGSITPTRTYRAGQTARVIQDHNPLDVERELQVEVGDVVELTEVANNQFGMFGFYGATSDANSDKAW